ncbi:MAG TPA: hypothetical protein VF516_30075 [Kofleriaceae bacterium]
MRAWIALLVLCAGCSAAARLGMSTSTTATRSPAAEVSAGPGGDSASSMLRPQQLQTLIGLTLDRARARLHELGHRGPIEIQGRNDFGDCAYGHLCGRCEYDQVCQVRPSGGTDLDGTVVLVVKARAAITVPEP